MVIRGRYPGPDIVRAEGASGKKKTDHSAGITEPEPRRKNRLRALRNTIRDNLRGLRDFSESPPRSRGGRGVKSCLRKIYSELCELCVSAVKYLVLLWLRRQPRWAFVVNLGFSFLVATSPRWASVVNPAFFSLIAALPVEA